MDQIEFPLQAGESLLQLLLDVTLRLDLGAQHLKELHDTVTRCSVPKGHFRADGEDGESVGVLELEHRVRVPQLLDQVSDPEIPLPDPGVATEHHASPAHLWQPGVQVTGHRVVGMQAVDVREIDRFVLGSRQRLVKQASHQY